MGRQRFTAESIVHKLREDEVALLDWEEQIEFIVNISNATVRKALTDATGIGENAK